MTVDLSAWTQAVPDAIVDRLRNARRVLAVGHENPDADTLGATLGIVRLVEALGGRADPVVTDPVPPLYAFLPGVERVATDPDPDADYDLLVVSDCGTLDRVGDVAKRHPALFDRLPRLVIDHHASNDDAGDGVWIEPGSAATCEMVTLLAERLGVPLDEGDGALATVLMGGIVMDTATFAHPNATPRTLVVWRRARRGRGTAVGHLAPPLPVQAGRPAPALRSDPRPARAAPRRTPRLVGAAQRRLPRHRGAPGPQRGNHRPARPGRGRRGRDPVQGGRARRRHAPERADPPRRRRRDRAHRAFGGGGHARAAGASLPLSLDEALAPVLGEAERLIAAVSR